MQLPWVLSSFLEVSFADIALSMLYPFRVVFPLDYVPFPFRVRHFELLFLAALSLPFELDLIKNLYQQMPPQNISTFEPRIDIL